MRPVPTRRRASLVAFLALLAPALAFAAVPKCALEHEWIRHDGEHFVLYTNLPAAEGALHAQRLDRFAQVFYRREPALRWAGAPRVLAFGLAGRDCYDVFRTRFEGKPVESTGMFLDGPLGAYFQYLVSGKPDDIRTLQHEYMHALSNEPLRGAPLALKEGLADFYSTLEMHRDEARFGHPIRAYTWFLAHEDLMSADALFGTEYGAAYLRGEQRNLFYAQSWALFHWLAANGHQPKIREFVSTLYQGTSAEFAFGRAFPGADWATLPATLKRHATAEDLTDFSLPMGAAVLDRAIPAVVVPRAEALGALGDLLFQQGRTGAADAQAFYAAALEANPREGRALAGMAAINQQRGFTKEALRAYERAARDTSNEAATWVRIGNGYVAEAVRDSAAFARRDGPVRDAIRRAREAAGRALARDPGGRDGALLFVRTLDGDSAATAAALPLLWAAHDALPEETEITDALIEASLGRDDLEGAEAALRATYGDGDGGGKAGEAARNRINGWRLLEVNRLVRDQKLYAAAAHMRAIRAASTDRSLHEYLDRELARLEAHLDKNADVGRFNQATKLANAGKYAAALRIYDQVVKNASDPVLLVEARSRAATIRKYLREQPTAAKGR
jgi:hypothetical protein